MTSLRFDPELGSYDPSDYGPTKPKRSMLSTVAIVALGTFLTLAGAYEVLVMIGRAL